MYIKRLELQDYKCFGQATIDFQLSEADRGNEQRSQFTLIVGNNKSGKSAILKAVALGAIAPVLNGSGYRPFFLKRRSGGNQDRNTGQPYGSISSSFHLNDQEKEIDTEVLRNYFEQSGLSSMKLREPEFARYLNSIQDLKFKIEFSKFRQREIDHLQVAGDETFLFNIIKPDLQLQAIPIIIGTQREFELSYADSMLFADSSIYCFIAGYHPSRRIELVEWNEAAINRQRGVRYRRVAGLFEEQAALRPLTGWFETLSEQRQQEVEHLLSSLLGDKPIRLTTAPHGDIYVDLGDGPLPFSVLSDGYRAFLAWTTDLIGQMCDVIPDTMALTDMTGIVLIDEIDAHLHPKWQRRVVQDVTRTFPNLQFIATTHSPLVAGTVHPENVLVTELQDDGTASVRRGTEALIGRSANEILLSSYFGLDSTRSGPVAEEITKLLHQATDGDQDAALKAMRLLAGRE